MLCLVDWVFVGCVKISLFLSRLCVARWLIRHPTRLSERLFGSLGWRGNIYLSSCSSVDASGHHVVLHSTPVKVNRLQIALAGVSKRGLSGLMTNADGRKL